MMREHGEALSAWLARQADATRVVLLDTSKLSGGAIQENWAVDAEFEGGPLAGPQRLVLRKDSTSRVAISLGRAEEFALLRAAFDIGVTVPEPLWLCLDRSVIGTPFFVMRRVEGLTAGHQLVKNETLVPDRPALARQLGRELARIHSIRLPRADLSFLPEPAGPPALALVAEFRAWLDGQGKPQPCLEWGLRWLERNAPPRDDLVLCHNDFRTGNYMVAEGRVSGILDWEFAAWGDRMADIGWFCAPCWRFGARTAEAGGIGQIDDFLTGYEAESGVVIDRRQLPYWLAMATMRWAIIALQQAARHVNGGETNLELALTAHIVPELELDILEMTREG
jgi:aminoglycoside phosphotransferase (APT) family kinase protein